MEIKRVNEYCYAKFIMCMWQNVDLTIAIIESFVNITKTIYLFFKSSNKRRVLTFSP